MEELFIKSIPFLTAVVTAVLGYILGKKTKQDEAMLKYKEEQYAKLLVKLQGFVGLTANGKIKKEFFEEQYKSWLYCSDEVVIAINEMVNQMIETQDEPTDRSRKEGQEKIGAIVVAMRKDLMGKTKLGSNYFTYTDVI